MRLGPGGKVSEEGKPRETRIFNGKQYLMETALPGDVAIVRAHKADEAGNCQLRSVLLIFCRGILRTHFILGAPPKLLGQ